MQELTKAAVVRLLSALTDEEFNAIATESRGVSGEQIAGLLRNAEYEQIQKHGMKETATQALRTSIGGRA